MPSPIRVLYTIPNFVTAGSGQVVLNIVSRLDRTRFEPSVCVLRRGGTPIERRIEELGVELVEAPFTVAPRPLRSLPRNLRRTARPFRHRYDVWHSFHYADDYTEPLVARLAGAKAWVYTKKNMGWNRRSWYLRSLLASRIEAVNSDMLKDHFADLVLSRKTRLIPLGVDTTRFAPRSGSRGVFRQELGLAEDDIVIAVVAHLVPLKGHPTLLRAVASVPEVNLLIAGRPDAAGYARQLHDLTRDLGIEERVHFLGAVGAVEELLADSDIAVLPTWSRPGWGGEGCPVSLLEAMASGTACIASDVPGSRDLITTGRNGFLVPPEDPEALADRLDQLSRDPVLRHELGQAARRRIESGFTLDHELACHQALYEELVKSR